MTLFGVEDVQGLLSRPVRGLLPTRLILVNYWLYPVQVFHFVAGRLFLTGHNGSGKSTALTAAITLLLDGDSAPARLDPFGGQRRHLRYYLLGGPDAGFQERGRRSYLALEFRTPEGEYQTIGLGLSAGEGSSNIGKWGFWIPGRVGTGQEEGESSLELVDAGQPLTERVLRERVTRIEPQPGEFASGQGEYASIVRRRIYGAGERDFQDTLDLLLTVRGSKLGREVRPAQIAELLRRSLPPLSAGVTGKLADGIERLDRHTERLRLLDTQTEAVRRVAEANFHAALTAARLAWNRRHAAAERAEKATAELETARHEQATQTGLLTELSEREAALVHDSEAVRVELEALEDAASGQENQLSNTERKLAEVRAALEQNRGRIRREREREDRTRTRQTETLSGRETDTAALATLTSEIAARPWWQGEASLPTRAAALDAAEAALKVYERDTERLTERQDTSARAAQQAGAARQNLEDRTTALEAVLADTGAQLSARARALNWAGEGLPPEATDAYESALETTPEIADAYAAIAEAGAALLTLAREDGALSRERVRALKAEQTELEARFQRLQNQSGAEPPLPAARARALEELRGAGIEAQPFYRLVKPLEDAGDLGLLEGALLASGLLTALVVDSRQQDAALDILRQANLADALLSPGSKLKDSLSAVLEPEEAAPATVLKILGSLSLTPESGKASAGVNAAGDWQNGVLAGGASDEGLRFLGSAARQRERERQLALLTEGLELVGDRLETAQDELDILETALSALETELDYLRGPRDLSGQRRAAARGRDEALSTLTLRSEAQEGALAALAEAQTRAAGAGEALETAFLPLALEAGAGRESLDTAQTDYRATGAQWAQLQTLMERLDRAETELNDLAAALLDHATERTELEAERQTAEATRDALQTTLLQLRAQHDAPDAAKLRARLNELRGRMRELERGGNDLSRQRIAAETRGRLAAERLPGLQNADETAALGLADAARVLEDRRAAHPRLAEDHPEPADLSPTASETDRQAADYALREEYDAARPVLEAPFSYHPRYLPGGPRFSHDGQTVTPDALLSYLSGELDAARALLTEEEARVFHAELIRELVEELDRKQREAANWIAGIRATLDKLRFHDERLDLEGRPRAPAGQPAEALARSVNGRVDPSHQPEAWWAGVRDELQDVVRDLQARAGADSMLSFAQELERALDYREWIDFTFLSVTPSGKKEITDRTFAQRSGGERSAVLYTFLFAALGARFDQLGPRVPRLIGLDEAFAGMDLANIGALYRVMDDLELSWIATSERRIDLSPALSGAATYQLIRVATARGSSVGSLCFVWDGHTAQEGRRYGLVE
ncbi:TIGR02680 family protein [Deinococcus saxicola]|uniref:SbcC/MukB-like Walker B domain-containing protein n=1 Tax=Deinococcus saxicola TaxID=249406 RepID=UPI0039F041BF